MATRTTRKADMYANVIVQKVTMSAANTLTFDELSFGLSVFDKVALRIPRVEFHPFGSTLDLMTAAGDDIIMGMATNSTLSSAAPDQQAVVIYEQLSRVDAGTAGSSTLLRTPIVADYADLPGGGILVTPKPLYWMMTTSGLASAGEMYVRLYFTILPLKGEDYLELLETRQFFG